jgi:hypothetical protein
VGETYRGDKRKEERERKMRDLLFGCRKELEDFKVDLKLIGKIKFQINK